MIDTVTIFKRAMHWVNEYSMPNTGIAVNSQNLRPYPEVSGYYIPTLLAWNERSRAVSYGKWLIARQHLEGCWGDANANQPYAFDTGQIIKGLLALAQQSNSKEWDPSIYRACEWMISLISPSGEPKVPDVVGWGDAVPSGILLYAYQAVREAGLYYKEERWVSAVDRLIDWFLVQPDLTKFNHLSHFHAYILEALCDLGFHERAREGMDLVSKLQRKDGSVPGFSDVNWVCSTGLFQYAIIWYKLGNNKQADLAFLYASRLQNQSGGWYGSYGWFAKYFPKAEISWAVKYFLDALQLRLKASFDDQATIFSDFIDPSDGRYILVRDTVASKDAALILDAGCGKGRYLRNLLNDCPSAKLYGCDLSPVVMNSIPESISLSQGSLLNLPFEDNFFDLVYVVEALEHAVHLDGALRELIRVVKKGGSLLIIDKDVRRLGALKLPDWEQWFDAEGLAKKIEALGAQVTIHSNIQYEGRADNLFVGWRAKKRLDS